MERVVGIRFRNGGKIYHFDPGKLSLKRGDYVIVNTEQGIGLGNVVDGPSPRDPRVHPA
jgi:cell fate regulator YaaT (PSP1 superfamily)